MTNSKINFDHFSAYSSSALVDNKYCNYSNTEEIVERSVWRAVIVQALLDASCQSKQPKKIRAKRRALQWLREESSDFDTVCELAGWDPIVIRQKIFVAMRKGCQWRQDKRKYSDLVKEFMI